MAISHICPGCGMDLARERAAPEPLYGLWIVPCPRCGRVSARRRPRLLAARRRARALRRAAALLVLRGATLLIGAHLMVLAGYVLAETLDGLSLFGPALIDLVTGASPVPDGWARRGGWIILLIWGLLSVSLGAVAAASLSHFRWWVAWLAWTGLLLAIGWAWTAAAAAADRMSAASNQPPIQNFSFVLEWSKVTAPAVASALLAGAGLPLGAAAVRVYRAAAVGGRRRLLARTRRRRHSR